MELGREDRCGPAKGMVMAAASATHPEYTPEPGSPTRGSCSNGGTQSRRPIAKGCSLPKGRELTLPSPKRPAVVS